MGKGDRKTAKGKRYNSSYGNVRTAEAATKATGAAAAPVAKKTDQDRRQGAGQEGRQEDRRQGLQRSARRLRRFDREAPPKRGFFVAACCARAIRRSVVPLRARPCTGRRPASSTARPGGRCASCTKSARMPDAQHAAIVQAERARGVDGRAAQRFLRRQPEMRAGQLHRQAQRQQRRGAGIAVGGHRHRHAVLAERVERRQLGFAQHVEGAGQQHRHGAAPRPSRARRPRWCVRHGRPTGRRTPPPAPRRRGR